MPFTICNGMSLLKPALELHLVEIVLIARASVREQIM